MRKISILLTGVMAFGVGGIARADSVLLDFEDLTVGSSYTVPSTFTTSGKLTTSTGPTTKKVKATVTVADFLSSASGPWVADTLTVENIGMAGGTGNELHTDNINFVLKFGGITGLDRVSFLYGAWGGTLNLGINGKFVTLQKFEEIIATPIIFPDVTVSVTPLPGPQNEPFGKIEISGTIKEYAYVLNGVSYWANIVVGGGQELWIDNVEAEGAPGTFAPSRIPTVSQWGLIVMAVLLVSAGTAVIVRRRQWIAT